MKPLLVLDLDETLIFATTNPPRDDFDFMIEHYFVFLRPGLEGFLKSVSLQYEIAVWTAATEDFASQLADRVFSNISLEFLWSRERCTRKFDAMLYKDYWIKDLKKVKRRGYDLNRVVMVDDTPRKLQRNYGNLVRSSEWTGDIEDRELEILAKYLGWLSKQNNFRKIEKRGWKNKDLANS